MNSQGATNALNATISDLIDECPHCGARAHFIRLSQESYHAANGDLSFFVVFRCVPCKKLVLKTALFTQNRYDTNENLSFAGWKDRFPSAHIAHAEKYQGSVPEEVLEDFKEGVICLANGCWKASVGMFRRALQSSLIDLGADPGQDLIDQIRNLESITTDIKDWAHNIRIFGNWGVHPQDDNLRGIDEEKAQEAQSFLEEFFNYVYVMPARVARARPVPRTTEETDVPVESEVL